MKTEAIFQAILGDYSDDGHGKTDTITVKISGDGVSDEVVAESYEITKALLGVGIDEICADYEDSSIDLDFYENLVKLGFKPNKNYSDEGPGISVTVDTFTTVDFSAISLLMFYIGYNIENFNWEIVKTPALTGWTGILSDSSFGYGLYY